MRLRQRVCIVAAIALIGGLGPSVATAATPSKVLHGCVLAGTRVRYEYVVGYVDTVKASGTCGAVNFSPIAAVDVSGLGECDFRFHENCGAPGAAMRNLRVSMSSTSSNGVTRDAEAIWRLVQYSEFGAVFNVLVRIGPWCCRRFVQRGVAIATWGPPSPSECSPDDWESCVSYPTRIVLAASWP
jgi:hypothetical protein